MLEDEEHFGMALEVLQEWVQELVDRLTDGESGPVDGRVFEGAQAAPHLLTLPSKQLVHHGGEIREEMVQ